MVNMRLGAERSRGGDVAETNTRRSRVVRTSANPPYPWLTWLCLAAVFAAGALAVVGVPPIDIHGPLHYAGIMDPLCGGTRATYLVMHGDLRRGWEYNPAVPVLVVAVVVVLVWSFAGRAMGRWITIAVPRRIGLMIVVAALVALEVNQQSHAALLTSRWAG